MRNRAGLRLENCLRALRWQELEPQALQIVVSDFGSEPAHRRSIDELAVRYRADVARTETREIWNRSRALNVGIQAAQGEIIFCTDADMLFDPHFVPVILEEQRLCGQRVVCVCRCHDLPESVPEQLWSLEDYPKLQQQATLRPTPGTGACQAAPRAFFFHARGYDEGYRYWGKEDMDMLSRAARAGYEARWISDRVSMLHQWHPTMRHDRRVLWHLNRWRYALTKNQVVKNRRRWGTLT